MLARFHPLLDDGIAKLFTCLSPQRFDVSLDCEVLCIPKKRDSPSLLCWKNLVLSSRIGRIRLCLFSQAQRCSPLATACMAPGKLSCFLKKLLTRIGCKHSVVDSQVSFKNTNALV